ncbi:MAG: tRNA pseudouridine(38-40) synthase TruA [Polynucleobacter sp.]|nr:tRNA pseudouridine(38-40) synthase TruA [Polynucleobacter sp.]
MSRIALGVQYDGTRYSGWQTQPTQNTVQDRLEHAINAFVGDPLANPVRVTAAGRTDSGVHALGQVIHFDSPVERDAWSWVRGLNSFLSSDIVVNWATPVSDAFDARFSAFERSYVYALHVGPCRAPTVASRAGYFMLGAAKHLDITAMRAASHSLLGEHDFSSFRSSECQSKTPIKTVYDIQIRDDLPWVFFVIRANAFLHHMVRNIVGSLLAVGQGRHSAAWMEQVLEAKSRQVAAPTFAPDGLYLARVGYPAEHHIPEPWLRHSWLPAPVIELVQAHLLSESKRIMI